MATFQKLPEQNTSLKLLLVGDSGVGKSHLMLRFTQESFAPGALPATVGVDYRCRTVLLGDKPLKLQIWDTAGLERFRSVTEAYFRGAQGVLVVYDITRRSSFLEVTAWLRSLDSRCPQSVKILVGNKLDAPPDKREVPAAEGALFARDHGLMFVETSAFALTNVEETFMMLTRAVVEACLPNFTSQNPYSLSSSDTSSNASPAPLVRETQKKSNCHC